MTRPDHVSKGRTWTHIYDEWREKEQERRGMLAERDSSTPQIPSAKFMAAAKDLVDAIEDPPEDASPARDVCAYATPVTTPELRRCSEVVPWSHHLRYTISEIDGNTQRNWRESKEAVVRSRVMVAVRERPFCRVSQTYVDLTFAWADYDDDGVTVVPQFYCRHCRGGDSETL